MRNHRPALDEFLASVERRAFRMAQFATGQTEEALDIVQDTMLVLVRRYGDKPEAEWRPLFFRILQNHIRDWYRRRTVRNRWHSFWSSWQSADDNEDPIAQLPDPQGTHPEKQTLATDSLATVEAAVKQLPLRQQQAFFMRAWEELSVSQTATAMQCSEGTVKTHYSRAVHALRNLLKDHES